MAEKSNTYSIPSFEERQASHAEFLKLLPSLVSNPEKQVILKKEKLAFYSKDQSKHRATMPMGVVMPATTEEVSAILKACDKYQVKITPRGAGTGVEGACIPFAGGLVVEMSQMKSMRFDLDNNCVWVGAGVKKAELNKECLKRGKIFGPDPASNPCVGGMVSTSGSGMSTIRYGTTRENVISLIVANHKGEIMQTRQNVRKSSAGLDLTNLYIGSEGTLGVVCEICFRLFNFEKYNAGVYACFPTTADAVRAVVAMRLKGDAIKTIVRCEMMNKWNMESTNAYSKMTLPLTATVLIEFTTNDKRLRDVRQDYNVVSKLFKEVGKAQEVKYLKAGKELDSYWSARRTCYFAAMFVRNIGKPEKVFAGDVCVPLTKLAEIVEYTEKIFEEDQKKCLICAHIADGNFHLNIPFSTEKEYKELLVLEDKMIKKAIDLGGTISGEHGIGVGRVYLVVREHGETHIEVQEAIKKALDPDNRLNAGAFYPSQQKLYPTAHL